MLKIEEVVNARICVLENAKSLFEEAKLLNMHGYFARAYTLAHICNEELSKIPMLVGVGMDLINGDEIDWKKFNRHLTSHNEKLNAMHTQAYLNSDIFSENSDEDAYEKAMNSTKTLNENKNNSLYAGIVKNKFVQPKELFEKAQINFLFEQVAERLNYFISAESKTLEKIPASESALEYRKMLKKLI